MRKTLSLAVAALAAGFARADIASVLGDNAPVLWLDASKESSLEYYLGDVATYTNGFKYVRRWLDCRESQTTCYGLNPRGEGFVRVYPYAATNTLNGMTTISFGKPNTQVLKLHSQVNEDGTQGGSTDGREYRRLPLNKPVSIREVIAVFGSQQGGGGG